MTGALVTLQEQHTALATQCQQLERTGDYAKLSYCTAAKNQLFLAIQYLRQGIDA